MLNITLNNKYVCTRPVAHFSLARNNNTETKDRAQGEWVTWGVIHLKPYLVCEELHGALINYWLHRELKKLCATCYSAHGAVVRVFE